MTEIAAVLVGVVLFAAMLAWTRRRRLPPPATAPKPDVQPAARLMQIYERAGSMQGFYQVAANPEDLLAAFEFRDGIRLLGDPAYSHRDLVKFATGDNAVLACMSLAALAERRELPDGHAEILRHLREWPIWPGYFALGVLRKHVPASEPLVGPVLLGVGANWMNRVGRRLLHDFIRSRLDAGESVGFNAAVDETSDQHEFLVELLTTMQDERVAGLLSQLQPTTFAFGETGAPPSASPSVAVERWQQGLAMVGQLWTKEAHVGEAAIEHTTLARDVQDLEAAFRLPNPRSVLVIGPAGVGKTTLVRTLASRLLDSGWAIFEAGDVQLIAGQRFIGDFEQRLKALLDVLEKQAKLVWYAPQFHQFLWTGRHAQQPRGLLDILLPLLEERRILILGETRLDDYDRLVREQPRCPVALDIVRIEPVSDDVCLEVARERARRRSAHGGDALPEDTLQEAWNLAQQYLPQHVAPGNLLTLLDMAANRQASARHAAPKPLMPADLYATLSQLTGLPESILDERLRFDLAGLRRQFEERILGQPEAIDCLVERVAMIKAGVTDPTRPLGVFMFAGPTGTGKTEIAKALAEYLFGSSERLIRIDMSELQTPESLTRLLGSPRGDDTPLVDQVRKNPFCVVLLDEFEKAHPKVWDLFLQVFDDGRLTDQRGETSDFRHAIVIMTSNLGGAIPAGMSLGFVSARSEYRPGLARRTLEESFSKEFLNRIDRIVMFKPLGRDIMRRLLRKELDDMMGRRGLRKREWAIEWGEDAIEFLLAKGFTADLGARPLKRAVERYVLSPLATAIVDNQVPQGDQFLFVHAEGDRLVVEFVDPEQPPEPSTPPPVVAEGEERRLEAIAFEPHGTADEIASLQAHHARLLERVEAGAWRLAKEDAIARMSKNGFWQSPDRFSVLGDIEYLERIERGVKGAGSLLDRLLGTSSRSRDRYPSDLVGHVAQRLYLLDAACAEIGRAVPRDAFLLVESSGAEADAFAAQIAAMYRAWARKRGMDLVTLEESAELGPYRLLLAVGGFAAFGVLQPETGLHVLEVPRPSGGFERLKVRVHAIGQPPEPAGSNPDALRRQAIAAFTANGQTPPVVVRRYRESPQLVRDSARGWRSGKLARILGGDFDLVTGDRQDA